MPELAEVDFFRRRWANALGKSRILQIETHDRAQVFRGADPSAIRRALTGAVLQTSETAAKQMMFRFKAGWLGIHLGMTGDLSVAPASHVAGKHDHLILRTAKCALVFNDPRRFGRVQFSAGPAAPRWWTDIAPAILSPAFTLRAVRDFLARRQRSPIKAVLLMQERFPGVGNWMADEILWRAGVHPRQPSGSLTPAETKRLWTECRRVCELAMEVIGGAADFTPAHRDATLPRNWLLPHRWEDGGRCPRTGVPLRRETIGGRTTCWSPGRQKLHR
ncbi:MAG TPA: DNA-formamidopyrimidine glycosylase family protein [Opitutaceae bacterium]